MEKSTILTVFDVDETLIYCDPVWDKEHKYEDLKVIGRNTLMIGILWELIIQGLPWRILTARTYRTTDQIAEILGIPDQFKEYICTRRHDLDHAQIDKIIADPFEEEEFLERMIRDKDDRLYNWMKQHSHVVMFDDRWKDYEKTEFNISVIPPLGVMSK